MRKSKSITRSNHLNRFLLGAGLVLALLALALWLSMATASAGAEAETPVIAFSSYYGGSGQECIFDACAIATDQEGNIYVAGPTRSSDFPLTAPYTTTSSSGGDLFVVKFAAGSHNVVYSTYLGQGVAQGIAVDNAGRAYIVGYTSDGDFATTANAAQAIYGGAIDALVVVLSADGSTLLYSSYLGGGGRDEAFDVAVDDGGSIYLTGQTASADFPRQNAHQGTFGGYKDAFVTKIAASGGLVYSTYLGGANDDQAWAIALDSSGSAYITGRSSSDGFPTTPGVVQPDRYTTIAGSDAIVTKMTPSGGLAYSTFYNDTSTNNGVDIALDSAGNAYLISTHMGVTRLNADASQVLYQQDSLDIEWNVEGEGGIAVDKDGMAFVTGWRGSGGNKDIVLTVLRSDGRVAYDRSTGGSKNDHGLSVAVYVDSQGHKTAYIAGKTTSSDLPLVDAVQTNLSGSNDLVVLSFEGLENLRQHTVFLPLLLKR